MKLSVKIKREFKDIDLFVNSSVFDGLNFTKETI